jgi:hypothetical protein
MSEMYAYHEGQSHQSKAHEVRRKKDRQAATSIGDHCKVGINTINVRLLSYGAGGGGAEKGRAWSVQLVRPLPLADVAGSISTRPFEAAEAEVKASFQNDEVMMTSSVISLRCPLGLARMQTPAKGRNCSHLQCFELHTFLQFHRGKIMVEWTCPVCNKGCPIQVRRRGGHRRGKRGERAKERIHSGGGGRGGGVGIDRMRVAKLPTRLTMNPVVGAVL